MHHRLRTAILVLILLAVMSGLYVFNRLVGIPNEVDTPIPVAVPFDGKVPPEIVRGDTTKKQVIFTFDAGSGDASVMPILDVLKKHGVKGTFFMTGQWTLKNAVLAKRIVSEGHEIFNHTYSHPHLPEIADDTEVTTQLVNMNTAFMSITGTTTKPYFRPPYGSRDSRVLRLAAQAGYQSVYWTIDARDWMENEGVTGNDVRNAILSNLQPGMIVLMHVGDTITGSILDDVMTTIEQRGYKAVSLTQGL